MTNNADDNGWNEWGRHVLSELQRLHDSSQRLNDSSDEVRKELVCLKTDITMVKMQLDAPREKLKSVEVRLGSVEDRLGKLEKAVDRMRLWMKPWIKVLSTLAGLLAVAIFGLLWAIFTGQAKIVF